MSYVTPQQLANQRVVTSGTFTDACQRMVFGATDGDYGTGTGESEYSPGASYPCSFQGDAKPDAMEQTEVPMATGTLYLAYDAVLDPSDRVKLTHIYGELQAKPLTYALTEGPVADGNVKWARLTMVTDGSSD